MPPTCGYLELEIALVHYVVAVVHQNGVINERMNESVNLSINHHIYLFICHRTNNLGLLKY